MNKYFKLSMCIAIIAIMTSCGNLGQDDAPSITNINETSSNIIDTSIDNNESIESVSSDIMSSDTISSTIDSSDIDDDSSIVDSIVDSSSIADNSSIVDNSSNVSTEKETIMQTTQKSSNTVSKSTTTVNTTPATNNNQSQDTVKTTKKTTTVTTTKKSDTTTTKPATKKTTTTTKSETKKPETTKSETKKSETTTTTEATTTTAPPVDTRDKYEIAFDKVCADYAVLNEDFSASDCDIIREYFINYAVNKFGSDILKRNKYFIPFIDASGNYTRNSDVLYEGGDYNPSTWNNYYPAQGSKDSLKNWMKKYIDGTLCNIDWSRIDVDEDYDALCWDVVWMYDGYGGIEYTLVTDIP